MSHIFSRQCEYALQALLYLAAKPPNEMTSITELANNVNLPSPFLAKILQNLAHRKLLLSFKGRSGGFKLAKPAREITLFHIIEALDGSDFLHTCVLGFPACSDKNPCATHQKWAELREGISDMLKSRNIADMAQDMKQSKYHALFK
ncbi:Rrf2 family transcriptional regulator [candidate division KSB1 bacterium]|nr:MAG: Rrf2 family transcriptional regulator [candidate division KSB1 bacterium]MBC6948917.1 Rrf2 family transcriptional regulator [candidate division KSB1 bacterium]MCE7940745.1 Rrf2 family transcriptional regulator [Chlorobi bacterium CHB1]NUM74846.1 Rrf2 family transcriptional regulator [candidate division KSB1 bacterium]RIK73360.1 MAG: Rrf2 family transcriptional regulator [candidate division KSB1 bacterium]